MAGRLHWTKSGPPDSRVVQIAIDPESPQTLYSVADSGICKTSDGGRHWEPLVSSDFPPVRSVTVDPGNSARVLIGTESDVYLSIDGGSTWKPQSLHPIDEVLIDPSQPDTIYATGITGFFRTVDGGLNWKPLNPPFIRTFTIGSNGAIFAVSDPGVILSLDRGETWVPTGHFNPPASAYGVATDHATQKRVYALTTSGLFRSDDNGGSWQLRGRGVASSLAVDPTNPAVLYSGAVGGVWKSVDAGQTWEPPGVGPPFPEATAVDTLAIDPRTPTTIYAGTMSNYNLGAIRQGLFKSEDGGATWSRSDAGLPGVRVSALAVDPVSPRIVYAGTISPTRYGPGAILYKSGNAGASWEETAAAAVETVTAIAVDPTTPALYIATGSCVDVLCNGRVLKSTDGGKTTDGGAAWLSSVGSAVVQALALDPHSPNTLYASIGCINLNGCRGVRSTDGGATWVRLGGGFPALPVSHLLVDPAKSGTIYATAGSSVFKSTDGGGSWSAASAGLPGVGVTRLAADGGSPETLYAMTTTGLFASTNGGDGWRATGLTMPVQDLAVDPTDSNLLYAATRGSGVLRSSDRGGTWQPLNDGLPDLNVLTIVTDASGSYLHAAPVGGGVFDLQLRRLTRVVDPRAR